ncbi:hypothetical protein M075_0581 [Bacteroides fragilis str. 20793-3]|nr:hypothetical protein M072_0514 [Bacteroides fragilis str. DS-208]EYA40998.1 hypothetical protein M075_0581 [Bacteroides fragilis str. 20793-3]
MIRKWNPDKYSRITAYLSLLLSVYWDLDLRIINFVPINC